MLKRLCDGLEIDLKPIHKEVTPSSIEKIFRAQREDERQSEEYSDYSFDDFISCERLDLLTVRPK